MAGCGNGVVNSIKWQGKERRRERESREIEIYVACINFIWKRSLYVSWDLEM